MLKMLKIATAGFVLGMGLAVAPAQAIPIIGAVTVSDTFSPGFLPCTTTTIVGGCTAFHPLGLGTTGGGTLSFLGTTGVNAVVTTWTFSGPAGIEITIPGFSFDIMSATVLPYAGLFCTATSCADALTIAISGTVTGAGFDPTMFTGTLGLSGSCSGGLAACTGSSPTGTFSGGYTYSLASSGVITHLPEPATLALLGLGLAGLGFVRRRRLS